MRKVKPTHIFLSCFDVSGDHHAADIVHEARKNMPGKFVFSVLGGQELKSLQLLKNKNSGDMAFLEDTVTASSIGLLEGLPYIFSSIGLRSKVKKFLLRMNGHAPAKNMPNPFNPFSHVQKNNAPPSDALAMGFGPVDIFLCIDGQGRNFILASLAKKMGCKIAYYFAPPIFIWGKWNAKKLLNFHNVFTVFSANDRLLKAGGVPTKFVGHPFSQTLSGVKKWSKANTKEYLISIFPGSRFQEINTMLPLFLEAVKLLAENCQQQKMPKMRFVISVAHQRYENIIEKQLQVAAEKHPQSSNFFRQITLEYGQWDEILFSSRFAFCCSGTVTLKAALFGVPHVIAYRISWLSALLARLLVYVKYIGIANILFEEEVSKELINNAATPLTLQAEARKWLSSPTLWKQQSTKLKSIKSILKGEQCLHLLCRELLAMQKK